MPEITVEYLVEKIKALHEAGKINFITKNNLLKRVTKFGVYDGIVEEIEKHGAVVLDEAHTMPDPSRPSIPPEQNLPQSTAGTVTNFSVADELGKLKALLDNGTITQDEFAAQKTRLLGPQRSQPTVIAPPQSTVPPTKKKKGHGCAILVLLLLVGFVAIVAITPSKHENSSPSSGTSQQSSPKPTIPVKDKKIVLTEGDKYFLTETADTITLGYKHIKFEDASRATRKRTRYSIKAPAEFLDLREDAKKEIVKSFRASINKDADVFTLFVYAMPPKFDSSSYVISYAPDKKGHSGDQDWEWEIQDFSDIYKNWEKQISAAPLPTPAGPGSYIPLLQNASSDSLPKDETTPTVEPKKESVGEIEAWEMAKQFVEKALVAPSTAKFPWFGGKNVKKVDIDTWVVTSYVDSQNRFGAMLRNSFKVKVMYLGNDQWKLLDIKISE